MKVKARWRRIGIGMLAAALLLSQPMQMVHAEEGENAEAAAVEEAVNAEGNSEEKTAEQIAAEEAAKKQASYDTQPDTNGLEGWPTGPNVYAGSAIIMDMDSGAILSSHLSLYPISCLLSSANSRKPGEFSIFIIIS